MDTTTVALSVAVAILGSIVLFLLLRSPAKKPEPVEADVTSNSLKSLDTTATGVKDPAKPLSPVLKKHKVSEDILDAKLPGISVEHTGGNYHSVI